MKVPIRVAILNYRDDATTGGSLRVGEVIANHLEPERIEAHLVFAYGGPGPVSQKAAISCHFLKAKGPTDFKAWLRARKTIRDLKPDVVHFMDNVVWLQAALVKTEYPKIVHVHGPFLSAHMRWRDKHIWSVTNRIVQGHVFISSGAQKSLLDLGLAAQDKSFVIYNGIDCSKFSNLMGKKEARAYLGLPQDALLLGMVCRLVPNKGCSDFLSIIRNLPAQWHGVLCGDGPQRGEVESQCRETRLTDRIHFLGSQSDVTPVYAALDAYAFLTRYESFGLVLAEAMAAGVPVFGLEGHGEYREPEYPLITDDNAVFVRRSQPSDYEQAEASEILNELAHRIADYGINPDRYSSMVERARAWVHTRFDSHIQAEAMTQVYEQIYRQFYDSHRGISGK